MPVNVNDVIKKLSPAQRKKAEARAAQLIAEEMTLRELRHPERPPVVLSGIAEKDPKPKSAARKQRPAHA